MRVKRVLLLLVGMVWFVGCSSEEPMKQQSSFIVFKTPTLRYADMGFVSTGASKVDVEIYSSGHVAMKMRLSKESVCFSTWECLSSGAFNQKVLSAAYPEGLLFHIFRHEALFDGENRVNVRNGFTQHLRKEGLYNIEYRVLNHETSFRDTINHITIKIKRIAS